jgi:hypothetical protein
MPLNFSPITLEFKVKQKFIEPSKNNSAYKSYIL